MLSSVQEFVDALTSVELLSQIEGQNATTECEPFVECLPLASDLAPEGEAIVVPQPAAGSDTAAAATADDPLTAAASSSTEHTTPDN